MLAANSTPILTAQASPTRTSAHALARLPARRASKSVHQRWCMRGDQSHAENIHADRELNLCVARSCGHRHRAIARMDDIQ
jgi:hypothetical protein